MQRRKQPKPPNLMGLPSPSLAKLGRMNREQLKVHIERLTTERGRLAEKNERLKGIEPQPADKIKALAESIDRLDALVRLAQERLAEKEERAKRWEGRRGDEGGPGGGGGGRSGGGGFRSSYGRPRPR